MAAIVPIVLRSPGCGSSVSVVCSARNSRRSPASARLTASIEMRPRDRERLQRQREDHCLTKREGRQLAGVGARGVGRHGFRITADSTSAIRQFSAESRRDYRNRRRFTVRRGPGTILVPRQPGLQRHACARRTSTPRDSPAVSRRRWPASRSTTCRALDGDDIWDPEYRADPKRYSRAALIARDRRPRSVERCRAARRRAGRRGRHRQRRRRHRRRRAAVLRLLRRARAQGHPVCDSDLDRRHDVERGLDLAAAARRQPRALLWLHELDRRHRLRGRPDSIRGSRRRAVGRADAASRRA